MRIYARILGDCMAHINFASFESVGCRAFPQLRRLLYRMRVLVRFYVDRLFHQ